MHTAPLKPHATSHLSRPFPSPPLTRPRVQSELIPWCTNQINQRFANGQPADQVTFCNTPYADQVDNCADYLLLPQCVAEQRYFRNAMTRSLIYLQVRSLAGMGAACSLCHGCAAAWVEGRLRSVRVFWVCLRKWGRQLAGLWLPMSPWARPADLYWYVKVQGACPGFHSCAGY